MSGCSKADGHEVTVKTEVGSGRRSCEVEEDDIHSLSGNKAFFDMILSETHLAPRYQMHLPASIVSVLPRISVPALLKHGSKSWDLCYNGNHVAPRFDSRWRQFALDNHLKIGDACVFELLENSHTLVRFKVVILRDDYFPPQLQAEIKSRGKTPETAIYIH